jgi:hypothetical protein
MLGRLGGLIMGNYRDEKGKGPTCALFSGIGKMLCWGSAFTQRVGVGRAS